MLKVVDVLLQRATDRSWKQVWAVLRGPLLHLLKERRDSLPSEVRNIPLLIPLLPPPHLPLHPLTHLNVCVCVCACMILFVRLVAIQGKCEAPVAPRVEFVMRLSAISSWAPYLCASLTSSFPRVLITSYYTPILILTQYFKKTHKLIIKLKICESK